MAITYQDGTKEFEGCVITLREKNWYDDSDFIAVVWDEEEGEVTTTMYGTTRFAGSGHAVVDASEEVLEKAGAWAKQKMIPIIYQEAKVAGKRNPDDFGVGDRVKVVKGRTAKGTTGTVFWMHDYGHYTKVGIGFGGCYIEEKKGKYKTFRNSRYSNVEFVYARNCKLVQNGVRMVETAKRMRNSLENLSPVQCVMAWYASHSSMKVIF